MYISCNVFWEIFFSQPKKELVKFKTLDIGNPEWKLNPKSNRDFFLEFTFTYNAIFCDIKHTYNLFFVSVDYTL